MKRQAVKSSNIKSIGFDTNLSALEIEFHTGSIYRYSGVPVLVYQRLMSAPSKGRFFTAHIKDQYRCTRVR